MIRIIMSVLLVLFYSAPVFGGIRCGNDLISIGDTKLMVVSKIQHCGTVLDKDTYTKEIEVYADEKKTIIEKRIDQWSVRIKEKGANHYCYPLVFEDGTLTSIGSWVKCD